MNLKDELLEIDAAKEKEKVDEFERRRLQHIFYEETQKRGALEKFDEIFESMQAKIKENVKKYGGKHTTISFASYELAGYIRNELVEKFKSLGIDAKCTYSEYASTWGDYTRTEREYIFSFNW